MAGSLPQHGNALAAAIAQLRNALTLASQIYATSPDRHRAAAMAALNAVYEFVEGIDELAVHDLTTPICALAAALADLERGARPKMLEPNPLGGGRRRDLHGREMIKGASAAVMSVLMTVGLEREEAAKRVAKRLHRLGVTLGGRRQLDWRTVASWRDQVKAAPMQGDFGPATTFHIWKNRMAAAKGWPPRAGELEPEARERFCNDTLAGLDWLSTHGGT